MAALTEEHRIQNEIRLAVQPYAVIFRINVGSGVTYDGRHFNTGVPKGFSDLFGWRRSDGKAIFIEVKTPKGRPSKEQLNFIERAKQDGCIAGICRSADDAIKLIKFQED